MKSFVLVAIVVIAIAISGVFLLFRYSDFINGKNSVVDMAGKSEVSIVLTANGYEPREVKIDKGTTVTFSTTRDNRHWPASNLHPSHDIYSELDPKLPLDPEESWSFIFVKEGIWGFHDHIRSYFTGVIYVGE
jgi:plastocyanin